MTNSLLVWNIQSLLPVEHREQYSRKVFVGGLPIDITNAQVHDTFKKFGNLFIDWPRRSDNLQRERPG